MRLEKDKDSYSNNYYVLMDDLKESCKNKTEQLQEKVLLKVSASNTIEVS